MDDNFIRIFNLYKNDIYRLAFSYTKNLSDSDDITQSVFVKLYKHSEILENKDLDVKKWLIKVTINDCKSFLLSGWKNKIVELTEKEENILYKEVSSNEVLSSVLELPKKYRIVIYLYYYENYKVKEIADILKLTETNVQTRLQRGRLKLKEILREE